MHLINWKTFLATPARTMWRPWCSRSASDGTGLEILARLCALSPRTRVIALQIGPVAFFITPFNDEKFLAAVHGALAQAKIS